MWQFMKILIVCSTSFYDRIEDIKNKLCKKGYEVVLPNCYDEPVTNEDNKKMKDEEFFSFFKEMYYESRDKIGEIDALLVLNFDKEKDGIVYNNYIGHQQF